MQQLLFSVSMFFMFLFPAENIQTSGIYTPRNIFCKELGGQMIYLHPEKILEQKGGLFEQKENIPLLMFTQLNTQNPHMVFKGNDTELLSILRKNAELVLIEYEKQTNGIVTHTIFWNPEKNGVAIVFSTSSSRIEGTVPLSITTIFLCDEGGQI